MNARRLDRSAGLVVVVGALLAFTFGGDRTLSPGSAVAMSTTAERGALKTGDQPVKVKSEKDEGLARPVDGGLPTIDGAVDQRLIFSDGPKGAIDEKSAVAGAKTLERLSGDEAAEIIASQKDTTFVSIDADSISARGIAAVVGLPRLRGLYIRQAELDIEQLRMVVGCTKLEQLGIKTSASDQEVGSLVFPDRLKKVRLSGGALGNNALRAIGHLMQLEELTITLKSVDGADISFLVKLPNLRTLAITGVSRSWLSMLSQLGELRELRLTFAANEPDELPWKLDCKLTRCTVIGPVFPSDLASIGAISSLESLRITDSSISGADLKYLSGLSNLKSLFLTGNAISDKDLEQLTGLSSLHDLDLSNTRVTGKGVSALASHKELKWLFLSDCDLTDELIPSLEQLKGLEYITVVRSKMPAGLRDKLQKMFPKVPF